MRSYKRLCNLVFLGIVLCIVAVSCGPREKYVSGEKIEIQYWGDITPGSWIKVDDIIIYHVRNEKTEECISVDEDFFSLNNPEEQMDTVFLPARKMYTCIGEKWILLDQPIGNLATNLIIAVNNSSAKIEDAGFKLEKVYDYDGNAYTTSQGQVVIKRFDGKKIRVSTSEGYQASVKRLED